MHTFMDNFQQGGKYSSQIAIQQAELRREEKFTDQKSLNISSLQTNYLNIDNISGFDRDSDAKKTIRNLLHANIDVQSRRLIAEFPKYGIKCIDKLQSNCANMNFADKSRYNRTFQQVTHKGG